MRSKNQKEAIVPIVYVVIFIKKRLFCKAFLNKNRKNQKPKINKPINAICPISTPILKNNKADITLFSGKPMSIKTAAKPKPCNKPKTEETKNGYLYVNDE